MWLKGYVSEYFFWLHLPGGGLFTAIFIYVFFRALTEMWFMQASEARPSSRPRSQDELGTLTEKEKVFARECQDKGIWLELFCPDGACFVEEERIKLPVFCGHPDHHHSRYLLPWWKLRCG
jgi:hypothetical protein